jgi:hypothetical protein
LEDFDLAKGWAKYPAAGRYAGGTLRPSQHFQLRSSAELNSLKLLFYFAARRDNQTNLAHVTYDQIVEDTGIVRGSIRPALSFLALEGLVFVEAKPSSNGDWLAHAYRLAHIDPYRHPGTIGRTAQAAGAFFQTT